MAVFNTLDNEYEITTYYEDMLKRFNKKIEVEEKKYPLTDREKLFIDTIKELLQILHSSCR